MSEQEEKRPGAGNRIVVVLIVAAIAWALYVVIKNVAFPAELQPPALVAQDLGPMDLDWRVKQLDGPAMDMSSVKGKVVVLNFWEHWCPPCRAEIGSLQRLYEAVKGEGILVLPVFQEDPDATRRFLQARQITMPVYQVQGELPADVAPDYIPTTCIIDPKGHVVVKDDSSARWDDPSVVEFLQALAGTPVERHGSTNNEQRTTNNE
jgi:thiol-disulfide isomerase/thioredoxin